MIAQADALSALSWWQLAGVDAIAGEDPCDWLTPAPAAPPPDVAPAPSAPVPQSLDAFRAWLETSQEAPLAGGRRILPSGSLASGLLLLSDQPEIADSETLFEGAQGRLLDAMLDAIGLARPEVYLASLSPARLSGRIDPATAATLADVARRHIALAQPRLVLLFGDMASNALLDGAVSQRRTGLHEINYFGGKVRTMATFHPRFLLTNPACKAETWQDLRLLQKELGR